MADMSPHFIATLTQYVLPRLSDQVVARHKFLDLAKKKKVIQYKKGGQSITEQLRYANSGNAGSTTDWAQRAAATSQPFINVEIPWAKYDASLLASVFQDIRNRNAGAGVKLFEHEVQQLKEKYQALWTRIGNHVYGDGSVVDTDDQGDPISGLGNIIKDDNTYLNLDRSSATYSWHRAQELDVTNFDLDDNANGVTNGLEKMKSLWNLCASGGKQQGDKVDDKLADGSDEPSVTCTTRAIYEQYENSLMGLYRFVEDSADPIKRLAFNDKPIIWDTFCPTGKLFIVNFDYWNIWTTSPDNSLIELIDNHKTGKVREILIGIAGLAQWTQKSSAHGRLNVS